MIDLSNYLIQGEPDQKERGHVWYTAIGLQKTDGLTPSDYLIATANKSINGDITLAEARSLIDGYYKQKDVQIEDTTRTEEADKVAARIAVVLAEKTFSFSPIEYITIHRRLFEGTYRFAGQIRDYNISKNEWVLNGETVYYVSAQSIRDTLDYDFLQEKNYDYKGLSLAEIARHVATFISGIWQIHAFGEGNTRTSAVFAIKYLRSFGFDVTNDIFAENAWYFRNALVRANYSDLRRGIHATREYLDRFFANLLLGESNVLRNRELRVKLTVAVPVNDPVNDPRNDPTNDPTNDPVSDPVSDPVKITATGRKVLAALGKNPHVTAVQLAGQFHVSEKTVKRTLATLKAAGLIERKGSTKMGHWILTQTSSRHTPR